MAQPNIEQLKMDDPHTARLIRLALERTALQIERYGDTTNRVYVAAFKKAARMVREAKPD